MTTAEILAELKSLCEKATEGPWSNHTKLHGGIYCDVPGKHGWIVGTTIGRSNGDFIAASRTAMPKLIAALELSIDTLTECADPECWDYDLKAKDTLAEISKILGGS